MRLLGSLACLSLIAVAGCSSEQVCEPNKVACKVPGQPESQVCNSDGSGWSPAASCTDGNVCTETDQGALCQPFVCRPGETHCMTPGSGAQKVCNQGGSGWDLGQCPGGQLCDNSGQCVAAACVAKTGRCPAPGTNRRDLCPDGTGWKSSDCAPSSICLFSSSTGAASCGTRICNPGEKRCSDDASAVVTCDATGGSWTVVTACSDTQACANNACVASSNKMGDLAIVTTGSTSLGPGLYSLAVVDTDFSGNDSLAFPLTVTGEVLDPKPVPRPIPFPGAPVPSHRPWVCGTPQVLAQLERPDPNAPPSFPPVIRAQAVGDTRTFRVAANSSPVSRTGRLRAIGTYANFWEDQTSGGQGSVISDSVLSDLVKRVDQQVVPRDQAIFGNFTDVDGNGKVDVFFTNLLAGTGMAAYVVPQATLFREYYPNYDYGEVVYAMGPDSQTTSADLAGTIAHEMSHLITLGARLQPYFASGWSSVPSYIDADSYIGEGLAEVAADWSGQVFNSFMVQSAMDPSWLSLSMLTLSQYLTVTEQNYAGYGLGSLALEYLFDQAGAVSVTGIGSLTNSGGPSYIAQVTSRRSGLARIAPTDGRTPDRWYPDLAAAMLASSLTGKLSTAAAANRKWQFAPTSKDTWGGGWNGPTLRWEWTDLPVPAGPVIDPKKWSQRPSTMTRGGMQFLDVVVGPGGAQLRTTRSTVQVVVVRHAS